MPVEEPSWKSEDRQRGIEQGRACMFAVIYPHLRERAYELGYSLALHGSMVRDLDVIAVPWVIGAAAPGDLARVLQDLLGGYFVGDSGSTHGWAEIKPGLKPYGRIAYTLRFGGGQLWTVDLSVMPGTLEA